MIKMDKKINLTRLEKGHLLRYEDVRELSKLFGVGFLKRTLSTFASIKLSREFTKDEIAKILLENKLVSGLEEALQKTEILISTESEFHTILGIGYKFTKSNKGNYYLRCFGY